MHLNNQLLQSDITLQANVEFTSKCNLRCTYCDLSQVGYQGFTLNEQLMPSLIEQLINRKIENITLNGHGETTMLKNWIELCNPLVEKIDNAQMISNFSKLFDERELACLVNFSSLFISIDTSEPQLLAQIRRQVDLGIIIQNIYNIRAKSVELGIDSPKFIFSTGVYDRNVFKLPDFAYWAIALNIDGIQFWNLKKYPDIEKGTNVYLLSSLSNHEKKKALRALDQCTAILEKNQMPYTFAGNFVEVFRREVNAIKSDSSAQENENNIERVNEDLSKENLQLEDNSNCKDRIIQEHQQGMTRDCFDPWLFVQIEATGAVLPCCVRSPVGNLWESKDLNSVLSNAKTTELRSRLLEGNLDSQCSICLNKSLIPVEEFKQKLIEKLSTRSKKTELSSAWTKLKSYPPLTWLAFLRRYYFNSGGD